MKKFKANDLYIIRPMVLVQANKYVKFKLPYEFLKKVDFNQETSLKLNRLTKTPTTHIKQTYLSLANDITIAELNNDRFTSVFDGKIYYKLPNTLECFNDNETLFVHQDYTKKVSDKLFQDRSVVESYNISWNDIVNNGIYESWMMNLDELAEKIINQEFSLDDLAEIRDSLISKEKDKLIIVDSFFTPNQSHGTVSPDTNQDLSVQKVLTKDRNIRRKK